jgi:hypothetical protein
MAKLVLLLVILFSTLVPLFASGARSPRRSVKKVQLGTIVMVFVWAYLCLTYYPANVSVN